jgi:hypothetical protein
VDQLLCGEVQNWSGEEIASLIVISGGSLVFPPTEAINVCNSVLLRTV